VTPADSARIPNLGPYYDAQDYAGIVRRFLILAIDGFVAAGVFLLLVVIDILLHPDAPPRLSRAVFYGGAGFSYAYFVLLEASALGTLGFLLTGVKIVTLEGKRPSMLRMTPRFLMWILGPINAIFDLYWMTGDEFKQTLRDKFTGTLVVRKHAIPAGSGEIRLNRYQLLGYSLVFYEVDKPKPELLPKAPSA
jgi:uncharacterized RDD family membrane protein YckC